MPLSLSVTVSLSFTLSLCYVLTIYMFKPKGPLNRNDPQVIKTRITLISVFTAVIIIVLPLLLSYLSDDSLMQIIGQMGLIPTNIIFAVDILKSLLLVVVLFGGPILDDLINLDSHASIFHSLIDGLTALRGIRDLLVAPLTEELVYTSSIITILLQSTTVSTWTLIVLPPVFFSIAHIHHAYELHVNKIAPLKVIIVSTLFQMLYTFIFGAFTDFIFLRQGNAWSCIIIHSFCNLMGVPNFSVDTRKFKYWNIVYYSLSLLGMYGFKFLLYPLTTSSNSLRSC